MSELQKIWPGSGPVRIRNDLDASHFWHFEAQEVG